MVAAMIYGLLFVFSLGDGTLVSFVEKEIPALSKAVEESVMFELLVSILSMCVGLFIYYAILLVYAMHMLYSPSVQSRNF